MKCPVSSRPGGEERLEGRAEAQGDARVLAAAPLTLPPAEGSAAVAGWGSAPSILSLL